MQRTPVNNVNSLLSANIEHTVYFLQQQILYWKDNSITVPFIRYFIYTRINFNSYFFLILEVSHKSVTHLRDNKLKKIFFFKLFFCIFFIYFVKRSTVKPG